MLLRGVPRGRPFKAKTTPTASLQPEPETFGPPAPPSCHYSITVESGTFKSIRPPLEWPDIPPLAVLTGLNGTGKTQLLRSISMMYADAAARKANIRLKIDGLSCRPHEVLFLEDFAQPFGNVTSGIAQLTTQADQYRKEKNKSGTPYDQQIRDFFQKTEVINNSNLHEAFYRNPMMLSRAISSSLYSVYYASSAVHREALYGSQVHRSFVIGWDTALGRD